jgi:hypothetical protein
MAQDNHMVIKGRKVWRTTAESPLDEKAGVEQAAAPNDSPSAPPEAAKKPVAVGSPLPCNGAASGIEVTEFAETLPAEIYSALFKSPTAG